MKLQKRLSRTYKGKKYYKYIIVIPEKEIEIAGLKEGDEIKPESKKDKIELIKDENNSDKKTSRRRNYLFF